MIVLDTGPIVAMVNADDDNHELCAGLLARLPGPLLLPEPLLGEIGYMLWVSGVVFGRKRRLSGIRSMGRLRSSR